MLIKNENNPTEIRRAVQPTEFLFPMGSFTLITDPSSFVKSTLLSLFPNYTLPTYAMEQFDIIIDPLFSYLSNSLSNASRYSSNFVSSCFKE